MQRSLLDLPNVVGRRLFTFILSQEIHKATRLQYPLSILCLTPDLEGRATSASFTDRLARLSAAQVRATDLAASLGPASVAILLIDAETRNLTGIFRRLTEGLELLPAPTLSGGGGCYPQTATGGGELLEQAIELMRRAKAEGGDRLSLPT